MDHRYPTPAPGGGLSRRTLLKAGLLAASGLVLPGRALAGLLPTPPAEKTLSLYNIHTGESLRRAVFWAEGELVPETVRDLNHLLRDHRTGEVTDIEPGLYELLFALRRELGSREAFHLISGYRSPKTNSMLARTSAGVAKRSLHTLGKAVDIRLPGIPLDDLRRAARHLQRGGVGYYPESDFVHVDTGRIRYW